jgi:hypothetical protein
VGVISSVVLSGKLVFIAKVLNSVLVFFAMS